MGSQESAKQFSVISKESAGYFDIALFFFSTLLSGIGIEVMS